MRPLRFLFVAAGLAAVTALLVVSVGGQAGTPVRLLITGGDVVTMDGSGRVIPNGAVAVDGDHIVAVGTADELREMFSAVDTIDARGQVVLPGLINTHTHAPMVLYRGLADDLALMDWLN